MKDISMGKTALDELVTVTVIHRDYDRLLSNDLIIRPHYKVEPGSTSANDGLVQRPILGRL